mmetsp:Transcript_13798/g.52518  ORF Transcript_13798/g.52518 Transcript_13798/m.52518 type:complete len:232 (-) Transcript_13798:85-780(-)
MAGQSPWSPPSSEEDGSPLQSDSLFASAHAEPPRVGRRARSRPRFGTRACFASCGSGLVSLAPMPTRNRSSAAHDSAASAREPASSLPLGWRRQAAAVSLMTAAHASRAEHSTRDPPAGAGVGASGGASGPSCSATSGTRSATQDRSAVPVTLSTAPATTRAASTANPIATRADCTASAPAAMALWSLAASAAGTPTSIGISACAARRAVPGSTCRGRCRWRCCWGCRMAA